MTHDSTLRARLALETVQLGAHPGGPQRHIKALESGDIRGLPTTRGEGVDASLVPGGSDRMLFNPTTNVAQIDVRTQGELSDRSPVLVRYAGYLMMDKKAQQFMARGPDARSTEFGDHHWRV